MLMMVMALMLRHGLTTVADVAYQAILRWYEVAVRRKRNPRLNIF